MIEVYFDGSCEPVNPGGNMGAGFLVISDNKALHVDHQSTPASPNNSNNVAEYTAILNALQWLFENNYQAEEVAIFGDSQLVIKQMSGEWRAKAGMYLPIYRKAKDLATNFSNISYKWIPRSENSKADELSRSAPNF